MPLFCVGWFCIYEEQCINGALNILLLILCAYCHWVNLWQTMPYLYFKNYYIVLIITVNKKNKHIAETIETLSWKIEKEEKRSEICKTKEGLNIILYIIIHKCL